MHLLLSLERLGLDVSDKLSQLIELRHVDRVVPVLGLELLPPLKVALYVFSRGLSVHFRAHTDGCVITSIYSCSARAFVWVWRSCTTHYARTRVSTEPTAKLKSPVEI